MLTRKKSAWNYKLIDKASQSLDLNPIKLLQEKLYVRNIFKKFVEIF